MIARDFVFHRAETVEEAVQAWSEASRAGGSPQYFSGGTEIVTLAREGKQAPTDLVDIKRVPETQVLQEDGEDLVLGASLTLNTLADQADLPLTARCAAGVADRTVRNSITLGGNICGMLPYREAVLPFLLLDGQVDLAGPEGERRVSIHDVFRKKLNVREGEFVLGFRLNRALLEQTNSAWFYRRRTSDSRIDYPVVTMAMSLLDGQVRLAVTGTWGYPYRALAAEDVARDAMARGTLRSGSAEQLAAAMVDAVDLKVKKDMRAGAEYRRELTVQALAEGLAALADAADADTDTDPDGRDKETHR